MDKELIERMKDAIEGECEGLAIDDHHAKAILEYVLDGYIARIDAERGKDAVAWLYKNASGFLRIDNEGVPSKNSFPVFLSPTIPDGFALVPIDPPPEFQIPTYRTDVDWPTRKAIYADFIAAAGVQL